MAHIAAAAPLHVAVIIGSTREGRVGDAVGRWLVARIRRRDDLEPTVVDLVDFDFPARYPGQATGQMLEFTARIGAADAFVVVTPEYNRSFPASLKQAIDYAYDEWRAKPVGFVSYGFGSTGLSAVDHLRTVFAELHTATMSGGVNIDLCADDLGIGIGIGNAIDGDGDVGAGGGPDSGTVFGASGAGFHADLDGVRPAEADRLAHAAGAMLDQLSWWGVALREARAVRPYVS